MGLMLHPSLPGCAGGAEILQAKPHSSRTGILRWFFEIPTSPEHPSLW